VNNTKFKKPLHLEALSVASSSQWPVVGLTCQRGERFSSKNIGRLEVHGMVMVMEEKRQSEKAGRTDEKINVFSSIALWHCSKLARMNMPNALQSAHYPFLKKHNPKNGRTESAHFQV
jgi:hypothetical protein